MPIKLESKNNELKLIFDGGFLLNDSSYCFSFNYQESKELLNKLLVFLDMNGATDMYRPEDSAYTEEINTYRLLVERTITISSSRDGKMELMLQCYTPDKSDDKWIILTVKRVAYLASLIGGYINHFDYK